MIFLDIDGVLNGYSKWTGKLYDVFRRLRLIKYVNKYYDLFGVRTHKVKILKRIIDRTGAKIVLSSSWRHGWYSDYDTSDKSNRQTVLHKKFNKYGIDVVGITPTDTNRREEIYSYIDQHPEIENYIVIDDETFNFDEELKEHMIKTSNTDYISGAWYENTGLKRKHVKQAVEILQ